MKKNLKKLLLTPISFKKLSTILALFLILLAGITFVFALVLSLMGQPMGISFDSLSNKNSNSLGCIDAYGIGGGRAGAYGVRYGHGSHAQAGGSPGTVSAGGRSRYGSTPEKMRFWQRTDGGENFGKVFVGDKETLILEKMMVYVLVEGLRARTIIDHIYYNPFDKNLQGRFEYPLTTGASVCYYAMFLGQPSSEKIPDIFQESQDTENEIMMRLPPQEWARYAERSGQWGELREARVVQREDATRAYEQIVRRRIDPAVLEKGTGNKFIGRVFPIRAKGYNRIILAYEETLEWTGEALVYRFGLPKCELKSLKFRLEAEKRSFANYSFQPKSATKDETENSIRFVLDYKKQCTDDEVLFVAIPKERRVLSVSGRAGNDTNAADGEYYFFARLFPEISASSTGLGERNAVFMLDTSLSESPDRFAIAVKLLESVIENDKGIRYFGILMFDVGTRWLLPKWDFWIKNDEEGRRFVRESLDGILLEGATDFSAALNELARVSKDCRFPIERPVDVFLLSNGFITWGEGNIKRLITQFYANCVWKRFRFLCYRTGLGAENEELFQELVRSGGSVFNCYTEDCLKEAATAHLLTPFKIERIEADGATDVLVAGVDGEVYPGDSIMVAGRCKNAGNVKITVSGKFNGGEAKYEFKFPVEGNGQLAARAWGEIAVSQLESLGDPRLANLVTALCQRFNIGSRFTSFLVLERDSDYKTYRVDEEFKLQNLKDVAEFINERRFRNDEEKVLSKVQFEKLVRYLEEKVGLDNAEKVKELLMLMKEKDFEVQVRRVGCRILHEKDVPASYVEAIKKRERTNVYATESDRRFGADEIGAGIRALSALVELNPERPETLRSVANKLIVVREPQQAVILLLKLLSLRPFEEQAYRDFGVAAFESANYGLAILAYELMVSAKWSTAIGSVKMIAEEEYIRILKESCTNEGLEPEIRGWATQRLSELNKKVGRIDLQVTVSWNTNDTDVDLWVTEPNGEQCYYGHRKTKLGGVLFDDIRSGYGPERYQVREATKGNYIIALNYFASNQMQMSNETQATVIVRRNVGTPNEETQQYVVTLKAKGETVKVCEVKF